MHYSVVFVAGGFPSHTYNPRSTRQLEDQLAEAARGTYKLVTVTGHTKLGKTVLVRKIIPTESAIWVDGGSINEEDDFWSYIIGKLALSQSIVSERITEVSGSVGVTGSGKAGLPLLASTELGASLHGQLAGSYGEQRATNISSRITAIEGLKAKPVPLVIDDFHYLSRELQASIVRALKSPIFDGLPVILIAIPHRRYDAVKVEREMTARVQRIDIPHWEIDELKFIAEAGFPLLGHELSSDALNNLAETAIGSPHLMQEFCKAICTYYKVGENDTLPHVLNPSMAELESVYRQVADNIGRPVLEKLARGPGVVPIEFNAS